MDGSILDKPRAALRYALRTLGMSPLAARRGRDGAMPVGGAPESSIVRATNRRRKPRAAGPDRPFAPFVCREAYCHCRVDLAANGK